MMAEAGGARALIDRTEKLGLRVDYDSGFLVVTRPARPEQKQENAAEMRQVIIEQLGGCVGELFGFAVSRARGARGKDFLGQQVFLPVLQIVGTLADCSSDGIVTVSCRRTNNEGRISNMNYIGRSGDDLLIIVDGGERSDRTPPTAFPRITSEKLRRLLERTDSVGLRLEHDSGFVIAKCLAMGNVEREVAEATFRQIGESMREVFGHTVARARGIRGKDFIGQQVFVQEFDALGVLEGCSNDGSLTVTYQDKHMDSRRTCFCKGDGLLIIVDGDQTAVRAPLDGPKSKPAARNWLRRRFEA
jgi:hypothetical protein